jgi:VanZ family protein
MPLATRTPPSLLPHYLAALYALAIAYASLQPFAPWLAPAPNTPFFLFAPFPPRYTRFDVLVNLVAYAPFGLFVALMPRRRPPLGRFLVALAAATALSFTMETLQMFLPTRVASVVDLGANIAGAILGALAGIALARSGPAKHRITELRRTWFVPGRIGDMGLALLAIWLVAQTNPGIPLFATTFEALPDAGSAALAPLPDGDFVVPLVQGTHSGMQLLGVGLFLALLLNDRRRAGSAVLLLIGTAFVVKGIAAETLIRPSAWSGWLAPGVSLGIAVGALLLSAAMWLPRPVQVTLAAIALLSSLLTTLLAPDLLFARAPLTLFTRSYGHLLNFNGLTRTVLLVWPLVASAYLFALAGRPRWGDPH